MKKNKILLFFFSLLLLFSTVFGISYRLGLSPLKTDLEMYPGEEKSYEISLMNSTLGNISYQVEVGSFELNENGDYIYLGVDQKYAHSASKWITFDLNDTDHVIVKPLESLKFKVHVKIPRNLRIGGDYYAMIWANFVPPNQRPSKSATGMSIGIERRFRFGSILHITVKGRYAKSKLQIERVKVINFDQIATATQRGLEIDTFLKNDGDTSFRPTGSLLIVSPDHKVWGKMDMKLNTTDLVMPGLVRKMYAIYDRSLPSGKYIAKISVKSGNRYIGQKEYEFSIKSSTGKAKPLGINIKLSPEEIVSDARSGSSNMGKFEIYNKEFTPITANLSVVSLSMNESGEYVFGNSPLKDVRIYPPSFSLRENQKRIVPFSYKIPKDSEGQMTFAIKIKSTLGKSKTNESNFYIPVMVRLDNTTKYGFEVTKVEKMITGQSTQATQILRFWVKNTGNVFTNFNIAYDILDPESNYLTSQAQSLSNKGFTIFPGKERYVDVPLGGYAYKKAGEYKLAFLLIYKVEKNKTEQKKMEIDFKITDKDLQKLVEGTT